MDHCKHPIEQFTRYRISHTLRVFPLGAFTPVIGPQLRIILNGRMHPIEQQALQPLTSPLADPVRALMLTRLMGKRSTSAINTPSNVICIRFPVFCIRLLQQC